MKNVILTILFCFLGISGQALEHADELAIRKIVQNYTDSWNQRDCKGFAEDFSTDADFVNIFGMKFSGKAEIENRHIKILQTFLKGSKLEIVDTHLREIQPGLVIGTIYWKIYGFHTPGSDMNKPGEIRDGIFTQVFVNTNKKWEITASQNTMIPN